VPPVDELGKKRDAADQVLVKLRDLARAADLAALAAEAEEALARLRENRFHLAVMGQFKRGKSTLINALLGEPVLPTGILPLTSVATEVRHGSARRAEVVFEDGRRETAAVDDLALYCTEKHNPGNHKRVARVEVELPNPLLGGGLVITDTPGIGSTHTHNTRAAYDYLSRADAAVLVFGIDPPVSEVESDFIEQARGYLDRLFFLLNKVDYATAGERNEALEFTREFLDSHLDQGRPAHLETQRDAHLGERGATAARLLPVSAKLALEAKLAGEAERLRESGLPAFEAELGRFIARSKTEAVARAAARRGLRLARELENQLATEEATLRLPLAELGKASDALAATLERGRARHREVLFVLDGELQQLQRLLDEEVDGFRERETASLGRRVEAFLDSKVDLPVAELTRQLGELRSRLLVADFETWRRDLEAKLDERLRALGERLEAETSALLDDVRVRASEILRVKLPPVAESGRLAAETRLWYLTGDIAKPFMPELNLLSFSAILPRVVVLGRLRRDLARGVAEEVDRNCGRVRYDVLVRLEDAGREVKASLQRRFEATLESRARGLERATVVRREGEERTAAGLERLSHLLGKARHLAEDARALGDEMRPPGRRRS